jgi:transglutaminase-like putative cysteine protease
MRYGVRHETHYRYSQPMNDGYTVAYLMPRPTAQQMVERALVDVYPEPDEREERIDAFGNRVLRIGMHHLHDELRIVATSEVVFEPMHVEESMAWELASVAVEELRGGAALQVRPFAGGVPMLSGDVDRAQLRSIVELAFTPGRPIVEAARSFCHEIYTTFEYDPTFTDLSTPLSTVLAARRGVCQDFAHLAVSGLRLLGLAARYVSGYIETDPPPGKPKLVGSDASHAWCSLWIPSIGWVDFDPTNDRLPTHRHVTVAWGRDYGDVPPVRGVIIGPPASQTLNVRVDVTRLDAA